LWLSARERPEEETEFTVFFSGETEGKLNLWLSARERPEEETEFTAFFSGETGRGN
jgi:hypothetical protein